MQLSRLGRPFTRPRGLTIRPHLNECFYFEQPASKQKWNEKKVFDQIKKKTKFKWDELQTQVQQMQKV
jgi:hypothetical protein